MDGSQRALLQVEGPGNVVRSPLRRKRFYDAKSSRLSQFADDTSLILDGSEGSFLRAIEVLDGFQVTFGLKVNYEKTKVLWVGLAKKIK